MTWQALLRDPDVQAAGVTDESVASNMIQRVNRLPFVEHWLRTGDAVWQTSSLKAALRMLHQVAPITTGETVRISIRHVHRIVRTSNIMWQGGTLECWMLVVAQDLLCQSSR